MGLALGDALALYFFFDGVLDLVGNALDLVHSVTRGVFGFVHDVVTSLTHELVLLLRLRDCEADCCTKSNSGGTNSKRVLPEEPFELALSTLSLMLGLPGKFAGFVLHVLNDVACFLTDLSDYFACFVGYLACYVADLLTGTAYCLSNTAATLAPVVIAASAWRFVVVIVIVACAITALCAFIPVISIPGLAP